MAEKSAAGKPRDSMPSAAQVEALEQRVRRACAELADRSDTASPDDLRMRVRNVAALRAALDAARWARRVQWGWLDRLSERVDDFFLPLAAPLVLLLGGLFLLGMWLDAGSTNVLAEMRTTGVELQFGESALQREITLDLDIELSRVAVRRASSVALDGQAAGGGSPLDLRVDVAPPLSPIRLQRISMPRRVQMEIHVGESLLTLRFSSPEQMSAPVGDVRVDMSVAAGTPLLMAAQAADGSIVERETRADAALSTVSLGVVASLSGDEPVIIEARLDAATDLRPVPLSLQGLDLERISFFERDVRDAVDRSTILEGAIRYRATEMPDAQLHYQEPLLFDTKTAQLVRVAWIPSSAGDDAAQRRWGPHLAVDWEGRVSNLRAGRESRGRERNLMPTQLIEWFGSRTKLYTIGVVVYAMILGISLLRRSPPGPADVLKPDQFL